MGLSKCVHCRAVSWKQLVAVAQIDRMGNCFVLEEIENYVWDPVKFILLSLLTDWQTFLLVMHTNPTFYFVNHATGRKNKKQLEYSRWL